MPADLAPKLRAAELKDGVLLVLASDAASGTRFRFLEAEVVTALKTLEEFDGLERMRVKVHAALVDAGTADTTPQTTQTPGAVADKSDYQRLEEAVLRLDQHFRERDPK